MNTEQRIQSIIRENDVVLFMKGTADFPQCGFSGRAVQLLQSCDAPFASVDVLADPQVRDAIKQHANWPTVPQLYVRGEFVGGSDIMMEMYESGELQELLSGLAKDATT